MVLSVPDLPKRQTRRDKQTEEYNMVSNIFSKHHHISLLFAENLPPEPDRSKTDPEPQDVTSRQDDVTDDVDEPTEEVEQIFRGKSASLKWSVMLL